MGSGRNGIENNGEVSIRGEIGRLGDEDVPLGAVRHSGGRVVTIDEGWCLQSQRLWSMNGYTRNYIAFRRREDDYLCR